MALSVKDRMYLQVRINGMDLPIKENSIDFLHIVESVRIYVPMLTFRITDLTKFLTRNNLLVDGAEIEITVEVNKIRQVKFFRLFSHSELIQGGSTAYVIRAYLSVPRYWAESSTQSYQGSASGCLNQICVFTGLKYDGLTTADSQLWFPRNQKFKQWAREVIDRAWVSDSSCMKMAVLSDKTMRVRDISKAFVGTPVQFFSNKDNSESQQRITDYEMLNKAGFFNAATGYKDMQVSQSIIKDDVIDKDLTFTKNSKQTSVNKKIAGALTQGRVTFAPIDVGNTSETYNKAVYQNKRLSNLFTFGIQYVTPDLVQAELLDTVNLEVSKPELEGVQQYSGKFLMTTKVMYIQGINFYQKCEVYRHGLNSSQGDTQL